MTTVLQFSGGKDSLACLQLLKPRWHEIIVCWVNTGMAFPETVDFMERIRMQVPHFHEVRSTQTIQQDGYPADVMPVARSTFGQLVEPSRAPRFQSRYVCCGAALWIPMAQAMRELSATVVIRGQKGSDALRSPHTRGLQDGIDYQFPLHNWTDEEVYAYLQREQVELPPNYRYMNTSLDCWNCTAYLEENRGKFDYLRVHHPEKHRFLTARLHELADALDSAAEPLHQILEVSL